MNGEVQKQRTSIPQSTVIILLISFIAVMLAAAGFFSYSLLASEKIYKGVSINGINAEGYDKTGLYALLEENFKDSLVSKELILKAGNNTQKLKYSDVNARYDIAGGIAEAYAIGRTGNVFQRLFEIVRTGIHGRNVYMPILYNEEMLKAKADEFQRNIQSEVKQPQVLVTDDYVEIDSGHSGRGIDLDRLVSAMGDALNGGADTTISIEMIEERPEKLVIDDLYNELNTQAVDASFKLDAGIITVQPHKVGRIVDKSVLAAAVNESMVKEDLKISFPVKTIQPSITYETAISRLFKDDLATFYTHFSTSTAADKNRGENIRLAASKIDGKILLPGEIFSFNETVGPRTEQGGYKTAHVYVAGKIVDGIGGGICQVSTTLYNSVLLSDLEIIERRNHTFTVGYVPYGRDATVSYGDVDFKFRNNTRWPIKINAVVTAKNNIYFTLKGTQESPGKVVELTSKTLKTIDFNTKYIDDPTLPEGKTEVKQKGMKGYVIETYKTIKQDGKLVSQVKLHTSTYKPLDEEVLRGTKKAPAGTVQPAPSQPAVPHTQGVDDADNPPAEE